MHGGSPSKRSRFFARLLKEAELPRRTPHDIRAHDRDVDDLGGREHPSGTAPIAALDSKQKPSLSTCHISERATWGYAYMRRSAASAN